MGSHSACSVEFFSWRYSLCLSKAKQPVWPAILGLFEMIAGKLAAEARSFHFPGYRQQLFCHRITRTAKNRAARQAKIKGFLRFKYSHSHVYNISVGDFIANVKFSFCLINEL